VAVAPVDVILPITKGYTARQPVASYSQVVEIKLKITLPVILQTGAYVVQDRNNCGHRISAHQALGTWRDAL